MLEHINQEKRDKIISLNKIESQKKEPVGTGIALEKSAEHPCLLDKGEPLYVNIANAKAKANILLVYLSFLISLPFFTVIHAILLTISS